MNVKFQTAHDELYVMKVDPSACLSSVYQELRNKFYISEPEFNVFSFGAKLAPETKFSTLKDQNLVVFPTHSHEKVPIHATTFESLIPHPPLVEAKEIDLTDSPKLPNDNSTEEVSDTSEEDDFVSQFNEALTTMTEMGYDRERSKIILLNTKNNVIDALDDYTDKPSSVEILAVELRRLAKESPEEVPKCIENKTNGVKWFYHSLVENWDFFWETIGVDDTSKIDREAAVNAAQNNSTVMNEIQRFLELYKPSGSNNDSD